MIILLLSAGYLKVTFVKQQKCSFPQTSGRSELCLCGTSLVIVAAVSWLKNAAELASLSLTWAGQSAGLSILSLERFPSGTLESFKEMFMLSLSERGDLALIDPSVVVCALPSASFVTLQTTWVTPVTCGAVVFSFWSNWSDWFQLGCRKWVETWCLSGCFTNYVDILNTDHHWLTYKWWGGRCCLFKLVPVQQKPDQL